MWSFLDWLLKSLFFSDSRYSLSADAAKSLQHAREDGYDFVTTVLPHTLEPRSDVTALTGRWWRTSVVGVVPENSVVEQMLHRLGRQLQWAIHMGIPAVILPLPPSPTIMEYARALKSLALEAESSNIQLWIKTLLSEKSLAQYRFLHRMCDGMQNISMMLVMDEASVKASPAVTVASQIVLLHKAIGANLKAVTFPTKIFLTNKRGYPTLSKSHQVIFTEILKRIGRTVRILIDGPSAHDIPMGDGMGATLCLPYLQYIRHVRQRPECVAELDSDEAIMEQPYLDSLQKPLQPLRDHLEFSMYETFEKDPVKYAKYQDAIFYALKDGLQSQISVVGRTRIICLAVVGAGRGPLVMRAIRAFQTLEAPGDVKLKIFAVEKNPSAVVYLKSMAAFNKDWKGIVSVIHSDARYVKPEQLEHYKMDIVVSELLGSFGDNELSPECLDPFLTSDLCKPSTVSIPMHYTTFLAPLSSARLHADARQQALVPNETGETTGLQRAMETSYVVRTHMASQTHPEQLCWTFHHPPRVEVKDRFASLDFSPDPTFAAAAGSGYGRLDPAIASIVVQTPASTAGAVTLHGLIGSFTATLYAGSAQVEISIAPHKFSDNMFSWFPIYFPIREPLHVPAGSTVTVKMWRKTSGDRVWYEWCMRVYRKGEIIATTPIHNPNGRSSHVSMHY